MHARSLRPLALLLFALPARASVLVVGPTGPFTEISDAVAAATDGDVVLVKSGTYSSVTIGNKEIDVVADVGAVALVVGELVVTNLDLTRTVTWTGISVRADAAHRHALRIENAAGSVRIQGCTLEGYDLPDCGTPFTFGGVGASLFLAQDVAFAHCTIEGGDASDIGGSYGEVGTPALGCDQSRVAVYECTLRGGDGGSLIPGCSTAQGGYAGDGGAGCHVERTPLAFFSGTGTTGGSAGTCPPPLGYSGCGGAGLEIESHAGQPARVVALQSSFDWGPFGQCPGHVQPQRIQIPGSSRRATAIRVVREQAPSRIDFIGQPGDVVLLTSAERGGFVESLAERGVRLLRPPRPTLVQIVGTIGSSGTLTSAWIVPDLGAGVESRRILVQPTFVDPSGQKTLGPPLTIVLVDSAF